MLRIDIFDLWLMVLPSGSPIFPIKLRKLREDDKSTLFENFQKRVSNPPLRESVCTRQSAVGERGQVPLALRGMLERLSELDDGPRGGKKEVIITNYGLATPPQIIDPENVQILKLRYTYILI